MTTTDHTLVADQAPATTTPEPATPRADTPPATSTAPATTRRWEDLIGAVLTQRDATRGGAFTAAIRAALTPATENQALGYTEAFLADLRPVQKIGARRAAAICAANPHARQPAHPDGKRPYRPVGHSLRDLYMSENNNRAPATLDNTGATVQNALLMQINSLPMLDVESAANVLSLLISRCNQKNITVDYYRLARTLIGWGNGITPASQQTRSQVLTDFYTPR